MFGGQIVQTRFFGKSCEHDWWTNRLNVADGKKSFEHGLWASPVNMIGGQILLTWLMGKSFEQVWWKIRLNMVGEKFLWTCLVGFGSVWL